MSYRSNSYKEIEHIPHQIDEKSISANEEIIPDYAEKSLDGTPDLQLQISMSPNTSPLA